MLIYILSIDVDIQKPGIAALFIILKEIST